MAAILWVLLVLTATSGCFADDDKSSSSSEEVVQPIQPVAGILPDPVDVINHKTANCPNGERFMSECNWCSCNNTTKQGMCTLMGCINWTCEKQIERLSSQKGCYGSCTCDNTTRITSCERKGCTH